MRRSEDIWWLYQAHENSVDLMLKRFQDKRNLPKNFQAKFLPIIAQRNILEIIGEWLPNNYKLEYLSETDQKIVTLKLSRYSNKKKIWFNALFNIIKYDDLYFYIIFTYEKGYIINYVIKAFFKRYYTEADYLHISSKQINDLLSKLEEEMNIEIITDKVISYNLNKDKRETNQKWTNEPYENTFEKAGKDNHLVDKINFITYDKKNTELFLASLSREGLFKCTKNQISKFYAIVINYLYNIGKFNTHIYSNRSITANNGVIKPISIRFDYPIFNDKVQNTRLVKALSKFRKSSFSTYHLNPYFYASLVDYSDGSSYDIWVLSENKITIIPRLRATFNSLSRLCEHIFQNFRDGKLEEVIS